MNRLVLVFVLLLMVALTNAQVRPNASIGGNISNNSAFLDASSSTLWNGSTNNGKGLVFPRVDLKNFTTFLSGTTGISNSFPGRFDGMIVYNTATGTAPIGGTAVTPGFYYYYNKSATNNGGSWVRMTDANDMLNSASATVYYGVLTTTSPTALQIQALTTKSVGSGAYVTNFDQAALASGGYFTLAIPVSWRNPTLKIGGSDTWDVFNAGSTVTINGVTYQIWQTDIQLTAGIAVAVN